MNNNRINKIPIIKFKNQILTNSFFTINSAIIIINVCNRKKQTLEIFRKSFFINK